MLILKCLIFNNNVKKKEGKKGIIRKIIFYIYYNKYIFDFFTQNIYDLLPKKNMLNFRIGKMR